MSYPTGPDQVTPLQDWIAPPPVSYTPALTATTTNPSVGAGSVSGWYAITGRFVVGGVVVAFGSGMSPGSGTFNISLPLEADGSFQALTLSKGFATVVGSATLRDESLLGASQVATVNLSSSTTVWMEDTGSVTDSNPWVWAEGDAFSLAFCYLLPAV